MESPWIKAAYVLAKEFGWTLDQVQTMTPSQVSMYLQLLAEEQSP